MEALLEGLNALYEWFASGIYDFVVEAWAWVAVKVVTLWYDIILWKVTFAWDIGSAVFAELSMAQEIQGWLSALPANSRSIINYAKVPEAINLLATAGFSKIVLKFII